MIRQALLASTLAALALAGCGSPASGGGPEPLTPLSRWALRAEPQVQRIALAVHEQGLSERQYGAVQDMVARFHAEGAPEVVVEMPSGEDPASLHMSWAVVDAIRAAGVPQDRVRLVAYAAPDPRAPILVGYARLEAVTYDCSREWGSITQHADNGSARGLGCASISNMAAQIADPRDLMGGRRPAAPDAGRRTHVIDLWRRGQETDQLSSESEGVSTAVD